MKLMFRTEAYNKILLEGASEFNMSIKDLIMKSCLTVGSLHDGYHNPEMMGNYSDITILPIELSEDEFHCLLKKADFNSHTIELTILESVKMFRIMYGNQSMTTAKVG